MNSTQVAQWKELAEYATDGPWQDDGYKQIVTFDEDGKYYQHVAVNVNSLGDREFICAARVAVPALATELDTVADNLRQYLSGNAHAGLTLQIWLAEYLK